MILFPAHFLCMKLIGTTVCRAGHGTINRDCHAEIGTVGNYVGGTIVIGNGAYFRVRGQQTS